MYLLVDMNNLAHRVFHTPQGTLTTAQGEPSGVILGTLNALRTMLQKFPEATNIIACWDGGKSEWRKEMYPEYKAQRDYGEKDSEKEQAYKGLWSQMETLHKNLHKFGVHSVKIKGQEADDIIAIASKELSGTKMIISSDKDLLQLISSDVSVYTPHKDKVIGKSDFYDVTGVTQDAYLGYRALIGDSSDNISGVPGIGEKTAKKLMDTYGHIDNILNAVGDNKKALLKSARTRKIYEPENINILARNNRIMSFKFSQADVIIPILTMNLEMPAELDDVLAKELLAEYQLASILATYKTFIHPFTKLSAQVRMP